MGSKFLLRAKFLHGTEKYTATAFFGMLDKMAHVFISKLYSLQFNSYVLAEYKYIG